MLPDFTHLLGMVDIAVLYNWVEPSNPICFGVVLIMANEKEVVALIKLQVPGGAATPAPPVGPALGQHQVPVGDFVQRFNAATAEMKGTVCPVEISVYADRSFDFIIKSPPAAVLLKKAAGDRERLW